MAAIIRLFCEEKAIFVACVFLVSEEAAAIFTVNHDQRRPTLGVEAAVTSNGCPCFSILRLQKLAGEGVEGQRNSGHAGCSLLARVDCCDPRISAPFRQTRNPVSGWNSRKVINEADNSDPIQDERAAIERLKAFLEQDVQPEHRDRKGYRILHALIELTLQQDTSPASWCTKQELRNRLCQPPYKEDLELHTKDWKAVLDWYQTYAASALADCSNGLPVARPERDASGKHMKNPLHGFTLTLGGPRQVVIGQDSIQFVRQIHDRPGLLGRLAFAMFNGSQRRRMVSITLLLVLTALAVLHFVLSSLYGVLLRPGYHVLWYGPQAGQDLGRGLVALGAVLLIAWVLCGWVHQLGRWRMIMAPIWMQNDSCDLVLALGAERASDTPRLSLIRFSAKCPVCGGTVTLQAGGKAFPDRLIGRCQTSPREHLYSFDPLPGPGKLAEERKLIRQPT